MNEQAGCLIEISIPVDGGRIVLSHEVSKELLLAAENDAKVAHSLVALLGISRHLEIHEKNTIQ